MQTLAEIIPKALANPSRHELHSSNQQSNSVTLVNDPEGRQELTNFLFQCFDALKVYGKEPGQMKAVNAMFQLVLSEYPIDKIRDAFAFYLKHNSDLPAPADIATIIERGNKPPFDKAVYTSICKRLAADPYAYGVITHAEHQYKTDYEKFIVSGKN